MSGEATQGLIDAIRVLRIELGIANDRVAAAAGINPRDLDVLDVIDRDAPCTPSHLVARTGIRAATLTGILARLESGGWIRRQVSPDDARSARLSPTERFAELRQLYAPMDGVVRGLVEELPDGVGDQLRDVVARAAELVRAAAPGITASSAPLREQQLKQQHAKEQQ